MIAGGSLVMPTWSEFWRWVARVAFLLLGVVGFLIFAGVGGLWLPAEIVTTQEPEVDVPARLEGYVLDDSAGWMSVLSEDERAVVRVESESVVSREVCTKGRGTTFGRSFVEFVGHDSTPVPLCNDLLQRSD